MKVFVILAALAVAASAGRISPQEVKRNWESFKARHSKTYASEEEENFRMMIFKDTLIQINEHNARYARGEVTYDMGVNEYSDLHLHEFVEKFNGLRKDTGLHLKAARVHRAPKTLAWPTSATVDWSKEGYVTPVKNQKQCGSCWAFSTTGALEGQLFKKTGKLVSLSEQNLMDCSWDYGNDGCNGGLMTEAFQYVADNGGIDTEESYPYLEKDGVGCFYKEANNAGTNTGFVVVNPTEKDLEDAVTKIGPISIGIQADLATFKSYKSGIYSDTACTEKGIDHGVLLVGYSAGWTNDYYWIVKNSWGDSWGQNGYVHIARDKKNMCGIASMASYPLV